MLSRMSLRLTHHRQAALNSLNELAASPLSSLFTMTVIALALTLPTLLWVVSHNLSGLKVDWRNGGHMAVYLKSGVTEEEARAVRDTLASLPGVGDATLKLPAEGLAELAAEGGMGEVLQYLPDNPLPAVIDVTPSLSVTSEAAEDALLDRLRTSALVEEVQEDRAFVTRLHALMNLLNAFDRGLMLLLAGAVVLIIGNTMRLLMHARMEVIRVLKLVGAPDSYIARPFLYSGIWLGTGGALLALFFAESLLWSLRSAVNGVAEAYATQFSVQGVSFMQTVLTLLLAALLGWMGAKLAVLPFLSRDDGART